MAFDRIITLSLNPVIDTTLHLDGLNIRAENQVLEEHFEAAGKAINVARALKKAGVESTAVIAAGRDNWSRYNIAFSREEIPFRVVFCAGNMRENISLVIDGVEDVTRLMRSGFSLDPGTIHAIQGHLSQLITPHSLVVAAGRLPGGMDGDAFADLCLEIQQMGAKIALDTSSLDLEQVKRIRPWMFKPNLDEFEELMGCRFADEDGVAQAARELRRIGVSHLLVSLGKDGMFYSGEAGAMRLTVPPLVVKSAVGAGDSLTAGFIAGYQAGLDWVDCLRQACAFGSASCLVDGTNPPNPEDVQRILQRVQVFPRDNF